MVLNNIKCTNCGCDYVFVNNVGTETELERDSSNISYDAQIRNIAVNLEVAEDSGKTRLSLGDPRVSLLNAKSLIIKRKTIKDSTYQDIAELPQQAGVLNRRKRFIDYGCVHNEDYQYVVFIKDDNNMLSSGYEISNIISPHWDRWTLLLGDNYINQDGKEDKNKVIINKLFLFELNVASGAMNLGTKYSQQENFTPYPKIQKSYAHNWSGTLKGLLGMIAPNDVDFIQTPNMLQEFKDLAINNQRKFLKDRDGNLWEVELTAAPSITNTDNLAFDLKEKQISWTEVANAKNIGLYAYDSNTEWVLTETGYPNPLNDYQILEDSIITKDWLLTDN